MLKLVGIDASLTGTGNVKQCTKCFVLKPLTEFNKDSRKRDGLRSYCRDCAKDYYKQYYNQNKQTCLESNRQWRNNNPERVKELAKNRDKDKDRDKRRELNKIYRQENRDKINLKKREYYQRNKELIKKKIALWQQQNKDKRNEQIRKHYSENPELWQKRKNKYKVTHSEKIKEDRKRWSKNNLDKIRNYAANRRSRINGLSYDFTNEDWENCLKSFNYECAYCGYESKLTQDHFIAVSKGGAYTKDNIVPACPRCNSSKGNKNFFKWYQIQGFYSLTKEEKILNYLTGSDNIEDSGG